MVSICIPTYNQTVFLIKTLDSIAMQTEKNFEVIICDDSTTDEVNLLVQNYENKFKITYIKNTPSLGSPANWNKAMDLANGDLIKFMHHDDWFENEQALSVFVKIFESNKQVDFVFCNSKILNVSANTYSQNIPSQDFISALQKNPYTLFCNNRVGAPTACMFKKTHLRFDENLQYVVDVDFYIHYLLRHKSFYHINQSLIVNTSHHPGQVTAASMNTKIQIGEYSYLYVKHFANKLPNFEISKFFFFLFRQYPIQSLKEILSFNKPMPRPHWFFGCILMLSKISLLFKKVQLPTT